MASSLMTRKTSMNRIDLIPTRTANGRHLVLQARPVTRRERLRRFVRRLVPAPATR
jgi:hypothetical protein